MPGIEIMEILTPRSLNEALMMKSDQPDALPIQGGTDVMVELNFDRIRPVTILNLHEIAELKGYHHEDGRLRLGAGLTFCELERGTLADELPALAEASRTVGSPQIRNRGTIGGNLGTSSPAGDSFPPLIIDGAEVECASIGGLRRLALLDFIVGVKRNVLQADELITAVLVRPSSSRQTFMKVGTRNAMVISVCSVAVRAADDLRASFGSVSPRPRLVTAPRSDAATFADRVMEAIAPIDDVRGSAVYRRHAISVLAKRAMARVLG
jgi:CO/xanthine dehydrogenase FAD-binding subunit